VVPEDLETGPHQQDQEQQIDVVRDLQPGGEAVRVTEGVGDLEGRWRGLREAEEQVLNPNCGDRRDGEGAEEQQHPPGDPDVLSAVVGGVNRVLVR
jgi:hypothetical protein